MGENRILGQAVGQTLSVENYGVVILPLIFPPNEQSSKHTLKQHFSNRAKKNTTQSGIESINQGESLNHSGLNIDPTEVLKTSVTKLLFQQRMDG